MVIIWITYYFIQAWLIDGKFVAVPGSNSGLANVNYNDLQDIY
jgi:hypothetical protein